MGKRGPRPQPTVLRSLTGERRPSRIGREPQPRAGPCDPPSWMQPDAAAPFDAYRAELDAMHVLTPADGAMLALLAETTSRRAELSRVVFASPPLIRGARSHREVVQNVAWLMWRRMVVVERGLLAEFGLSPASRASMRFGWHEPPDERDALLTAPTYD